MIPSTTEIWEEFSDSLRRFIRKRVNDPQDAEDILQDVFIKIHNRIDTLQDEQRLVSWLYQITRNTIIDHYRKQHPWMDLSGLVVEDQVEVEPSPSAEIAAGLINFIACLPEKYRQALLLTEFEGFSQAQLAESLGISLSGAKSQVQRGRAQLRQALLECCHFEFDRRGNLQDYIPRQDCCRN
jgi:RNA polymerase sigma-70 factor, ECF subfamily